MSSLGRSNLVGCQAAPDDRTMSYPIFWPNTPLTRVLWSWIFSDFSNKISAKRYFKIPHFWFRVGPSSLYYYFILYFSILILKFHLFTNFNFVSCFNFFCLYFYFNHYPFYDHYFFLFILRPINNLISPKVQNSQDDPKIVQIRIKASCHYEYANSSPGQGTFRVPFKQTLTQNPNIINNTCKTHIGKAENSSHKNNLRTQSPYTKSQHYSHKHTHHHHRS